MRFPLWDTDLASVPQIKNLHCTRSQGCMLYQVSVVLPRPFGAGICWHFLYIDINARGEERKCYGTNRCIWPSHARACPERGPVKTAICLFRPDGAFRQHPAGLLTGMGPRGRCYPAHAAQGQKGKHDLAHRIAKTGGCSPKGRNHSQEAENMADGLWISPRAVLQSKIRK